MTSFASVGKTGVALVLYVFREFYYNLQMVKERSRSQKKFLYIQKNAVSWKHYHRTASLRAN